MSVVFDRAAPFYDRTRGLTPDAELELAAAVRRYTALRPGSRVLEIGVGTGRIALPLARLGLRYTGIDLSVEMMRALRAKPGAGHIMLARADAARLPFGDHSFDALVAVHIFHLVGDWAAAMDELRRVLRPGGVLLHGKNWQNESEGPWLLRRRINELAGSAAERRDAGLIGWNEIEPQLKARFGEPKRVTTRAWKLSTSPREELEQLRERVWSHSWSLGDAAIERAAQQASDWAIRRWGSLDASLRYKQRFEWDIYTGRMRDEE